MHSPGSFPFSARRGFSLIELLAVMAVMAVLAAASVPAISGLTRGNVMNKNLLVFAGVLEQARQLAISKNTYVWVVLSDPAKVGDPIKVGQIASRDGTDALAWSSSPLTLSASTNLEMVGKPRDLSWVRVENSSRPNAGVAMANVNIVDGLQGRTYTRAIQFTPTGEARVGASVSRFIDVAILQDTGNTSNQGVLRIAGLTGKTSVQRD